MPNEDKTFNTSLDLMTSRAHTQLFLPLFLVSLSHNKNNLKNIQKVKLRNCDAIRN